MLLYTFQIAAFEFLHFFHYKLFSYLFFQYSLIFTSYNCSFAYIKEMVHCIYIVMELFFKFVNL